MTTVDSISPCTTMALPIGARSLPISSIGPIITSYLTDRPSELKVCGGPCPGPREWRNFYVHDIIGEARCRCCCDGNGLCWNSRDIGRFRTLYCYCSVNCCDKPVAKWREDAFTVLTVLTLRQSLRPPAAANIATVGTGEALARGRVQANVSAGGSCLRICVSSRRTGQHCAANICQPTRFQPTGFQPTGFQPDRRGNFQLPATGNGRHGEQDAVEQVVGEQVDQEQAAVETSWDI